MSGKHYIASLNGQWQYRRKGGKEAGVATVPGDIYRDLLENGQIPDPFYRDNEERLLWIGESDWIFERNFDIPAAVLQCDRVLLRCGGLDTLATIRINGKLVAETDNMFREWEWDVKNLLRAGTNTIRIVFASAVKYSQKDHVAHGGKKNFYPNKIYAANPGLMRKEPCNFGWDWGIKAVSTRRPALWVWLEIDGVDARVSDNFCHLRPGAPLAVTLQPAREMSVKELRKRLIVRSLVDTY